MCEDNQLPDTEALSNSLMDIAIESWRFGRVFERLLTKLDAGEQTRYQNQFRWFQKRLEESMDSAGMRIVNIEGQMFDPGIAASAINLDEFRAGDQLMIDQMIEPVIMGRQGLLRSGKVMLRRIEK